MKPLFPLLLAAALCIAPALAQQPTVAKDPVTKAPAAKDAAGPEKPVGAGILSDLIREGDVSPGDKYNLEVGSRFHRIHTRFMAIQCVTCHSGVKFPDNIQYLRKEEFPLAAYPGAVDRGTCMGCHRGEGALATPFYGIAKQ
ncbi:hypothetical protein CCR97_14880 [Rhodoplanes elegans]|uniref:Uncharacterized protein n=1 Tax=Rhodoplanes elegans TaxID=29408 RepID=A0A327KTV7_9BRAD|nr:hypothetical protein [Rhodoplanes elegans]MBK5959482.1 hypothetical protein [Rhodoplanes elegans]RAI41404.1 hypothetical protein CH338_03285 [Rhodoplanes elegans]